MILFSLVFVLFTEIAFLDLSVSSKFPTALLTHSVPEGSVHGHLLFIIYLLYTSLQFSSLPFYQILRLKKKKMFMPL